jgi:fatty acid hydroxylase family protein
VTSLAAEGRRGAPVPGQPAAYTAPGLSLAGAARLFTGCLNARLIAAAFAVAVVARITVGGWTTTDAIVTGVILGLEPLTEWVIHVTVLHLRPFTVRGRTIDFYIARRHRAHHLDPRVIRHVLVPRPVVIRLLIFSVPLYWLVTPTWRSGLTGLVTGYAMLLLYEWTHFLIHSTYQPRSWYYRYIYRAHRLHHFKNEKYWFGVTIHLGDHLLRTFPARDAVETSPTARTLGVEPV